MTDINTKLTANTTGIVIPTDYAGAASDPARVQLLIDLISLEGVDGPNNSATRQARGYLDEMSPMCRDWLFAHLTKLKAAVS